MKGIHPNSVVAYWQGRDELFGKRHLQVVNALRRGVVLSDREVMVSCGFSDMNSVRPRITELIEAGIAEQCGDRECPVTRKRVRLVRLVKRATQAEFDLESVVTPAVVDALNQRRTA